MDNYRCAVRSNYFHVKDEEKFLRLMSEVYGCENDIELWEDKDENNKIIFGFGVYGGISGVHLGQADEDMKYYDLSYDKFIDILQECVADDDAIIILESGNDELHYIVGSATIITSTNRSHLDIIDLAKNKAAELLCNPSWVTRCDY